MYSYKDCPLKLVNCEFQGSDFCDQYKDWLNKRELENNRTTKEIKQEAERVFKKV